MGCTVRFPWRDGSEQRDSTGRFFRPRLSRLGPLFVRFRKRRTSIVGTLLVAEGWFTVDSCDTDSRCEREGSGKSRRNVLTWLAGAAGAGLATGVLESGRAAARTPPVTVIHGTQFHGRFGGRNQANVSRYATTLDRIRDRYPNTILLGTGDDLAKRPFATPFAGKHIVEALDQLQPTAATTGIFGLAPQNIAAMEPGFPDEYQVLDNVPAARTAVEHLQAAVPTTSSVRRILRSRGRRPSRNASTAWTRSSATTSNTSSTNRG